MPEKGQPMLNEVLRDAVREAKCPGAVAYVGRYGDRVFHEAEGFRQIVPNRRRAEKNTIYDLASLTKVVATTTAVLFLYEDGAMDLDAPVSEYLPVPAFGRFTIRQCLTHTAGLHPGMPLYKECTTLHEMIQRYSATEPSREPGTRRVYSDVGFMILGAAIELASRDSLDGFCSRRIFRPLEMHDTAFNPPKEWADRCAATEQCAWRKRLICGEVHDENAYAVGGVSGHAGLFSTASDLAKFCRALLEGKLLREETVTAMRKIGQTPVYPWQGLGWKLDPWAGGNEGFLPSRAAIGHTGWTGTSIWIDFDNGLFSILLSNACHPSREKRDASTLRHVFYEGIARAFYAGRSNVHTGLDRLLWDGFGSIRGKRLAVLANHAAVDQLGRPLLDVLAMEPSASIRRVYSPEHGFHGQAEAGAKVASETGQIPVISLYGDRTSPSRAELAETDLFLVDLPDVGSRYYTYMATMKECLAACGDAGVPVLILDRPNPLGGLILEGPVAERFDSPVCYAPVPVRHGMTPGELAKFFALSMSNPPRVDVSELDGWRRDLFFTQCALPWVSPSPNMPDPETALFYTGACLFEGTNLNEGRGTDTPFKIIGAPWLDAEAIIESLEPEDCEGCGFASVAYIPRAIPGKATHPKYRDEACKGIRLRVEDAARIRPFRLAIALMAAMRRRHVEFMFTDGFDILAGTSRLRRSIEAGKAPRQIVAECEAALIRFDSRRPRIY